MTPSRWRRIGSKLLAHPKLGAFCAFFSGAWCALGSVLGRVAPNYHHRHAAHFGWAPRWHGLWSFALLVVIAVWCVQSAMLLHAEAKKCRLAGPGSRRALVPHVIGLAFVFAFGVYAWFVIAAPSELVEVTARGTVVHGEYYRAVSIDSPRTAERGRRAAAWLERRIGDVTDKLHVERGKWWPSRLGGYEIALARGSTESKTAVVRHADQKVVLNANQPARHGIFTYLIREFRNFGNKDDRDDTKANDAKVNDTKVNVEINGAKTVMPVDPEWAGSKAFLGWKESPVLFLRVHRVLTIPLAILAVVLLAKGVYLWRRHKRMTSGNHK